MSEREALFLKKLRNTLWVIGGSLMLMIITATIPFYFKTINITSNNATEISELKKDKADKDIYELTVENIKTELKKINSKLDKL